jgi:hypothetical protein
LSRVQQQLLADVDLREALEFLRGGVGDRARPVAIQFMGCQGSGKTTHLLALLAQFPNAVYSPLPIDQPVRVRMDGEPILVDDAQLLPWWQRWRLFRSSARLVLGTHRDYSVELRRAGRRVLTLSAETSTNPESLRRRLNARIEAVRRVSAAVPVISAADAEAIWRMYGSDQRSAIEWLYFVFEELGSPDDPLPFGSIR